jgi:hypothetical protein
MYKKMYIILFNAITDALQENNINKMKDILKKAQVLAEEICLTSEDDI